MNIGQTIKFSISYMIFKVASEITYMHALIDFHPLQSLLQDISSHQRMVDSVVEKAQGVLQATNNPEVAAFITEISSRYEHIARTAKVTKIKKIFITLIKNLAFADVNHI